MNNTLSKIRINQTGYASSLPVQVAVLAAGPLTLSDSTGKVIKTIIPDPLALDEASGDEVRLVDLGILAEGEYTLTCAGSEGVATAPGETTTANNAPGDISRTIRVTADPWQEVTNALIKGLYFQRCGCELEAKYAGKFVHPACHTAPALGWEDRSVKKTVTGGWHDAGDFGKYVGPGAVTVAHMLYAHILFAKGCSDELNIPESGNGVPDILNEARYELEWMLKMQREDGAFYHKLTKDHFADFIMPEDDHDQEYLMPVSHCATAAACACLALASRVYKEYDEDFASRMLDASLAASGWLDANPDFIPFVNPDGVRTGEYGDGSCDDELFWAACELFASTGDVKYRVQAEKLFPGCTLTDYGWEDVSGLGAICALFVLKEKAGDILYTELKDVYLQKCKAIGDISDASGYGTALPADGYVWGSILPIMANSMSMILYGLLTGDESLLPKALIQWDYALGLNALDICFVTGCGERPVMNPHHRPSGADGIEEPVPGLISGGPNNVHNYPFIKEKLAGVPAAKHFVDELPSADTNEIAIYWNSPAIFVGAYFSSLCKKN